MAETYHLLPILCALLLLYSVSWMLSRQKKFIDVPAHRKIWNAGLFVSFFGMLILSLANVVRLDYGIRMPIDVSFWHAEFGIAAVAIAFFHAAWHLPYFMQYVPKPAQKKAEAKEEGTPSAPAS